MKYGYTIIYVSSVEETLEFYQKAFGFSIKMLHESKAYGELDTGGTVLAFASHELGKMNLKGKYLKGNIDDKPFGIELAFVTQEVEKVMANAIENGAALLEASVTKPWGQQVGYLRDLNGFIIEICSPIENQE